MGSVALTRVHCSPQRGKRRQGRVLLFLGLASAVRAWVWVAFVVVPAPDDSLDKLQVRSAEWAMQSSPRAQRRVSVCLGTTLFDSEAWSLIQPASCSTLHLRILSRISTKSGCSTFAAARRLLQASPRPVAPRLLPTAAATAGLATTCRPVGKQCVPARMPYQQSHTLARRRSRQLVLSCGVALGTTLRPATAQCVCLTSGWAWCSTTCWRGAPSVPMS